MSNNSSVLLFVGIVSPICAILFWLQSRAERKARARAVAASKAFQKRLANPDLDGLERRLGLPLPVSFRALYQDHELINSSDVLIGVPNPLEKRKQCYLAWFMPADLETLLASWPGCEGLFPIANNGAGDQFLIDLRQPDPEVIYYLHESGERKEIGARLSAFLAAPSQPVPDE